MNRAARRAAQQAAGAAPTQTPAVLRMEVRTVTDSDDGLIVEGSANDTQETDSYQTRFVFTDRCINESQGGIVLFNHDHDNAIGRNLEMTMRGEHLWVRDVIDPGALTPNGRSIPDLIRSKVLRDFSIRFDNDATITFGREFDTITPNHLVEHSVVTLPSNRGSTMSEYMRSVLRNLEQSEDGAEIARVFRIGFAASEGRAVVDPPPQTRERKPPVDFAQRDIGPLDFHTLLQRLYDLLEALDWWAYAVAVYEDAVVYNVHGRLYRRSFTVDDAGEVTLGDDETEVLMTFAEANTAAADTTPEVRHDKGNPATIIRDPMNNPIPPNEPTGEVSAGTRSTSSTPTTEPAQPQAGTPPAGNEPVGEMTLDELREALLAEEGLAAETPADPAPTDADRPLSLDELQAGLVEEPETIPTT